MTTHVSQKNGFLQAIYLGSLSGGTKGFMAGSLTAIPVACYISIFPFHSHGRPGIHALDFVVKIPPRAIILGTAIGGTFGAAISVISHIYHRIQVLKGQKHPFK